MSARRIAVATVARSDYGIYLPLLRRLEAAPGVELLLLAGGMHLDERFGLTVREIERDGFSIAARIEMPVTSDSPAGAAASMAAGVLGFSQAYARLRPDLLIVLGDRFEMHAAAAAAVPFALPIAHIAGGELSLGAIDDALRHSLTKFSHLHFVTTAEYGRRVRQMGEEDWRVTVSGSPALDHLLGFQPLSPEDLRSRFGVNVARPFLLATLHPTTLEADKTDHQVQEFLAAIAASEMPAVFTLPNADPSGQKIAQAIRAFVEQHRDCALVENFGTHAYFSVMGRAAAMVGNSSSGIIEAASFRLPVVNIGTRQQGRIRAANVLDVGHDRQEILVAIRRASSPEFRHGLSTLVNPYGDGHASRRIFEVLTGIAIDDRLLRKRFADHPIA